MTKQSDLCPFSIAGAAKTGCGGLVDVCCRQGAWFYSGGPEGGAVLLRPTWAFCQKVCGAFDAKFSQEGGAVLLQPSWAFC